MRCLMSLLEQAKDNFKEAQANDLVNLVQGHGSDELVQPVDKAIFHQITSSLWKCV